MENTKITPYTETLSANISTRRFNQDIPEEELVWHRDREDRIVKALHQTDWQVQLENELPTPLTKIFIPKGLYHRVIKGTEDLIVEVTKL
jgi:lysyl-tRNA synthetase class I